MKLNKDEARLLAAVLDDCNVAYIYGRTLKEANDIAAMCKDLQDRLDEFGVDERRNGRTSLDDFADLIRRMIKSFKQKMER